MVVGLESWTLARPELFLAAVTALLLIYGVVRGEASTAFVSVSTSLALLVTAVLLFMPYREGTAFASLFIVDRLTTTMKALVLVGAAITVLMSRTYFEDVKAWRFEYPLLVALATLGMMLMISANDLMALYVGLELQSLALYVVAAFQRDSVRSTEAGVKYFVLGSVASGMLLFGASLIYGFCGGTAFVEISKALIDGRGAEIGTVIGLVFVVAGLAFKVSAVPFHMWTPDVYEGAPTPVTALFAVAPKIAAVSLLVSVLMGPFKPLFAQWQQIIVVASVLSMALGAFAALRQQNIKRLMAYSSIGNVGYILLGLAAGSEKGIQAVVFYLAIYLVMTLGVFATILLMKRRGVMVEGVNDLAGLGRTHPMMAFALLLFMFSLAGIPPLAGFWGKLYIFMAAVEAKLYWPGRAGRAGLGGGVLLLPAHRQGDVLRRAGRGARPAGLRRQPRRGLCRRHHRRGVLAGAAAAQRRRRRRRQGPLPVSSTPVLPDGWRLVALDSVGSTNDEAARLADAGAPEGTVVWAREQTGGRGRRGRAWASPVGNLYTSTILRPDCPAARAAELGFVSALAVADIVPPGRAVRVKWPNDVLVDGGKIAGILLESAIAQTGAVQHVIAGIGINVGFAPQLPEMRYPGAALGGSVEAALEMFTAALAQRLAEWRREGFEAVRAHWLAKAGPLGGEVDVKLGDELVRGRFGGVDHEGALLLETSSGPRRIVSGELLGRAA